MEQQSKRKNKYALLLVTQKDEGTMKQYSISPALVEVLAAILFLLVVVVICKFVYD